MEKNNRIVFRNPNWKKTKPIKLRKDGFKFARPWQKEAFDQLKDEKFTSIYAPPSSGKGIAICLLATEEVRQGKKVIIVVPQRIISEALKNQKLILPSTKEKVYWAPKYLNDSSKRVDSNKKAIKDFLEGDFVHGDTSIQISNNVLVTSHSSLVDAFSTYKNSFKDVAIYIDEHHHIQYDESEDECVIQMNKLGEIIRHALTKSKHIELCLTTATAFRGDKKNIVPDKYSHFFKHYAHPYDEAWDDFSPLESFALEFVLYKNSGYRRTLQKYLKKFKPSIIYIPNVNSQYSVGSKYKDVEECYKSISGSNKPILRYLNSKKQETEKGNSVYTLVKRGKEWITCVDLVSEKNRAQKGKAIDYDHNSSNRFIDVVITLGMFKEGANWKWAEQTFIIGNRNSFREFVQMKGRLFRSCDGKKSVTTYYLLPHSKKTDEEYEENFNTYTKALISALLLIKIFHPKLIATKVSSRSGGGGGERNLTRSYLDEALGDDVNKVHNLQDDIMDAIVKSSAENKIEIDLVNNKLSISDKNKDILAKSMVPVLKSHGIKSHHKEIIEELFRWYSIQNKLLSTGGMNVGDVNYNIISKDNTHPLAFLLRFTSENLGANTFREYRLAVDKLDAQWEENYQRLVEIKKKGGDVNKIKRGTSLNNWCIYQRKFNNKGKLSNFRIKKLDDIGFVWDVLDTQWEENFEAAIKLAKKSYGGDLNKINTLKTKEGDWLSKQRATHKKGELSKGRVKKLELAGFIFENQLERQWTEAFEAAIKLAKKSYGGDLNKIEQRTKEGGWLSNQKTAHKKGKLLEGRIKKLENAGIKWKLR